MPTADEEQANPLGTEEQAASVRVPARRRDLAVLLLFISLAALFKMAVWLSPLTHISAVTGAGQADPVAAMWFLRWTPFAIGHGTTPFTSDYLNYPRGLNLMWNTWMPAVGVLLWPFTALGGAAFTYNVVTTGSLAFSGFFAYLAIRRYVPNRIAAVFGGLIYGFSPYMVAQETPHAQMVAAAVALPLGLLLLDELLVQQRFRPWLLGSLIAIAGIFQFLVLEEYFVTELLAAALLTLILAVTRRNQIRRRARYALSAVATASVIVLAVLAYPVVAIQLRGPNRVFGLFHDPSMFVTDLLNLVVPTSTQLISPQWAVTTSQHFTGTPE